MEFSLEDEKWNGLFITQSPSYYLVNAIQFTQNNENDESYGISEAKGTNFTRLCGSLAKAVTGDKTIYKDISDDETAFETPILKPNYE